MPEVVHRPAPTLIGGGGSTRVARTAVRTIRVALLDEREAELERTAGWLAVHAPDLDVVLTATTWPDLVRSPAFPAELVVLDVQPGQPVSTEARVRTCRASGAKVVVRTGVASAELRARIRAAGAEAVLDTDQPLELLAAAARAALDTLDGESADWRPPPVAPPQRPRLSLGEEQALKLYTSGSSTIEVAQAMHVQFETAKTYLRRVRDKYAKVDRPASRRADLVRRAIEDGYLS